MTIRNFVVFEGGDGSGTTTQLGLLKARLAAFPEAPAHHICFEPTDGPLGALIRSALRGETRLHPDTVARLFAADRGEHLYGVEGVVQRAARGELVVSDRYVPSSLVYQGLVCGEDLPAALNAAFPKPELVIYFEIDPEVAIRRISGRAVKDEFEKLETQRLVKARYDRILPEYAQEPCRMLRIDASLRVEEVAERVWSAVRELPIFGR